MTSKKKQFHNLLIYFLPLVISALTPIVTLPLFTRILTPEDYGRMALAMVYGIFVGGLANMGMSTAYERNFFQYRHSHDRTGQLLYSSLVYVTFGFSLAAGITWWFQSSISAALIGDSSQGPLVLWALAVQYVSSTANFFFLFYRNQEQAGAYAFWNSVVALINLGASIVLVAVIEVGVVGILQAQVLAYGLVFSVLSIRFARQYRPAVSRAIMIESLKIGSPLTPRIFLGVLGSQIDKYMIRLLSTLGGAGVYEVGQRISRMVFTCLTTIQHVYAPQVFQRMFDDKIDGGRSIGLYLTPFAYLSISFALMTTLFAEEIITLMTPPEYHEATGIVIISSIYYGLLFFNKINGTQILFRKKTYLTSLMSIITVVTAVGLNVPFIHWWGATGAAWASLATGLLTGSFWMALGQRYYRIEWEWRPLGMMLAVLFLSAFGLILMRWLAVDYWIRIPFKVIALMFYVWIGHSIGVITMENFRLVRSFLKLGKA